MTKQFALLLLFIAPLFAHDNPPHMSPVPEPGSVGMLVVGGASLIVAVKAFRNRK